MVQTLGESTDVISFRRCSNLQDSKTMIEDLWREWLDTKLYLMAKGTLLMEEGYSCVFNSLSREMRKDLIGKKGDFAKVTGKGL